MGKSKKTIIIIAIIIATMLTALLICNFIINKYSVPGKEERKNNMLIFQEKTEMDDNDIASEIGYALEKHTNWDNLFLSDNFKSKFKNRESIIGSTRNVESISCYSGKEYGLGNVIVITVDYKKRMYEDETEAVSTEFYYEYKIDSNNEIDDLILKDKKYIYTFDGEPIVPM